MAPEEEFGPWKETLLELQNSDIRGPGREDSESTSRFVQSWIWTTAIQVSTSPEDPDLQAALRVEWCKGQERAKRYEEEVELVVEEMRRTLATFEWNAREWRSFAISPPTGALADAATVAGIAAFANKQADIQKRMASTFVNDWYHPLERLSFNLPWLKQYPRPPEPKRQRLRPNVQLYHPESYTPDTNIPDELTSDEIGGGPLSMTTEDFEDLTGY